MRLRFSRHRAPLLAAGLLTAVAVTGCGSAAAPVSPPKTIRLSDAAAAAVNPVTVTPFPGTPDASPATQISFLGGPGTTASAVSVVGSRSGTHDGKLEAYSTGTGESFLPAKPFESGEHVTVVAHATQDGHSATVRT